jgi:hypothetical protein
MSINRKTYDNPLGNSIIHVNINYDSYSFQYERIEHNSTKEQQMNKTAKMHSNAFFLTLSQTFDV